MTIEVKIEKNYSAEPKISVNDTDFIGVRSKMVLELVCKWGMVAAIPDGEDSSGRSKLRLMTEEEVVNRAMKTIDLLTDQLEQRDWMIQMPTYEIIDQAIKNIIEEKENNKSLEKH